MKKIVTLFAILITVKSFAQTDSFEVKESKFQQSYNFFTMAKKEEVAVWKLKAVPFNLDKFEITFEDVPIIFSYEKKLTPKWSIQVESKNILFKTGTDSKSIDFIDARDSNNIKIYSMGNSVSNQYIFSSSIAVESRYYYNMKRRMHRKHLSNNFSADYLALRVNKNVLCTGVDFYNLRYDKENPFYDKNKHPFYDNTISLFYGIQRRFLKNFFFDVQGGLSYRYSANRPSWNFYVVDNNNQIMASPDFPPRWVGMINARLGFAF